MTVVTKQMDTRTSWRDRTGFLYHFLLVSLVNFVVQQIDIFGVDVICKVDY